MQEFDAIRPYRDDEVPEVVARWRYDARLVDSASRLVTPGLAKVAPWLARGLARAAIGWKSRGFDTVESFQLFLSHYFARLLRNTVSSLTVTGIDGLDPDRAYLYMSNHRDIVMDTGLVNYSVHKAGFPTPEAAVGDNLFTEPLATDLMRLNKSFVIERGVTGKRAIYRALTRTSHYIQHTLTGGDSVWIAQREGRSKDGFDRTEPALLKMLALAWRKEAQTFGDLLDKIALVPVSISYELDPCDRRKARELAVIAREGRYQKAANEDLASIIEGMTGFKGRVHVHFSPPMQGQYETADDLASALDREIVRGLKVYPPQAEAAAALGFGPIPDPGPWIPEVKAAYEAHLAECPESERPFLLAGYGNLIRNRSELKIGPDEGPDGPETVLM
jgi:1-acyl-sn-glycerol-3-phosphate acyltransferase